MNYHITPGVKPNTDRSILVIGDSVSAGMGGNDASETWPKILAKEHELNVEDLSHVGETAASALKRVREHTSSSSLILVEIGGNDLLGSTTTQEFAEHLDALLSHLSKSKAQVVMLELPLPPFCHEWGRIQRTLSRKHDVVLVPKRYFLSVLADGDATLDTIHLSQAGHQAMADTIWGLIESR